MSHLTNMPKNQFTAKLIDVILPETTFTVKSGIFIVMEYIDSDLKKVLNSIPQ